MGAAVRLEGREGLSQAPIAKPYDPFLPLVTEDFREGVRSSGLLRNHNRVLVWMWVPAGWNWLKPGMAFSAVPCL